MSLTAIASRTIHLAGPIYRETAADVDGLGTHPASAAITPGMLVEMHLDTTVKWRPNGSATEATALAVALNQPELNKGIEDAYATGDLVQVGFMAVGSIFNAIIPSGQNISACELLQSNGDGKLKSATATTADANLGRFQSLDSPGSVLVDTRIRVQVIN